MLQVDLKRDSYNFTFQNWRYLTSFMQILISIYEEIKYIYIYISIKKSVLKAHNIQSCERKFNDKSNRREKEQIRRPTWE